MTLVVEIGNMPATVRWRLCRIAEYSCPQNLPAVEIVAPPIIWVTFDDIVDHCCYAWNTLIDQAWKIMSIARRDWTMMGHSM